MPVIQKTLKFYYGIIFYLTTVKQSQLEYLALKENIDIILLVETFLKPIHTFKMNDFIIYRNDRPQLAHGGVAVAVRRSGMHTSRNPYNTKIIENIAIDVMIENEPIRKSKLNDELNKNIFSFNPNCSDFVLFNCSVSDKKLVFLLDTGAEISIVKEKCLKPDVDIDDSFIINIKGITDNTIKSLGVIGNVNHLAMTIPFFMIFM